MTVSPIAMKVRSVGVSIVMDDGGAINMTASPAAARWSTMFWDSKTDCYLANMRSDATGVAHSTTTRTIIWHDGRNHLGLRCDAHLEHQTALITSGCAPFSVQQVRRPVLPVVRAQLQSLWRIPMENPYGKSLWKIPSAATTPVDNPHCSCNPHGQPLLQL